MRLTLQTILESSVPRTLGLCATDVDRVAEYVNEAQLRMIARPDKFNGTYQRYKFCTTNSCITLPSEIATVEEVWLSRNPIAIRNEWFEAIPGGYGIATERTGQLDYRMKGNGYCTFADMIGQDEKIKVYCDVTEEEGAKILFVGNDENLIPVRTEVDGTWQYGEYIALNASTPQLSTKFFTSVSRVVKPVTNGFVRVYAYNTLTDTQRAIAVYAPEETLPSYTRGFIPGLAACAASACETGVQVEVLAKLEFVPVRQPTDFLLIGNLPAMKEMCLAVLHGEGQSDQSQALSVLHENKALQMLREEVGHYLGDGAIVNIVNAPNFGGGNIANVL